MIYKGESMRYVLVLTLFVFLCSCSGKANLDKDDASYVNLLASCLSYPVWNLDRSVIDQILQYGLAKSDCIYIDIIGAKSKTPVYKKFKKGYENFHNKIQ